MGIKVHPANESDMHIFFVALNFSDKHGGASIIDRYRLFCNDGTIAYLWGVAVRMVIRIVVREIWGMMAWRVVMSVSSAFA